MTIKTIRIGTRASRLAVTQAEWVRSQILAIHPHLRAELVRIKTTGDKITDVALAQVGGKGLFVKEIEAALLAGGIDLAVHSMKDMPAEILPGLCIGAIPERENSLDVLISRNDRPLKDLPGGARLGTSSLRRSAQVRHARPDIIIHPLRGNLDTRIQKLKTEGLDAIIVAAAGVKRLGLEAHITQYLPETIMLPAIGQGALGIEIREDDASIQDIVSSLDHRQTRLAVEAERAFLQQLMGGCQVPIAARAKIIDNRIELTGLVAEVDGTVLLRDTAAGPVHQHRKIGVELADRLLERGGRKILEKIFSGSEKGLTT